MKKTALIILDGWGHGPLNEANAIFNASGARVRSWPITAEKIKAAQRGA